VAHHAGTRRHLSQLAQFFDRIGKFSRIVNVTGLSVKGKENDGRATISASCVATTFVLLEKPTKKAPNTAVPPAPAKKVA